MFICLMAATFQKARIAMRCSAMHVPVKLLCSLPIGQACRFGKTRSRFIFLVPHHDSPADRILGLRYNRSIGSGKISKTITYLYLCKNQIWQNSVWQVCRLALLAAISCIRRTHKLVRLRSRLASLLSSFFFAPTPFSYIFASSSLPT